MSRAWQAPYLLLTLAALFWSGNFVIGRAVHAEIPPVALAFWRWAVAFLIVLGPALPHLRRDAARLRHHWRGLMVLSAFGVAGFNTMIYLGLQSTTALNALLLQSAMPLMILLWSLLLFAEPPRPAQLAGLFLSLLGVGAIVTRGEPAVLANLRLDAGDAWVLAAVLSYALYSALLRRRPDVHPLSFLAVTFGIGAVLLAPFTLVEHLGGRPLHPDAASLLAIAYVALFPSVLAYFSYNRGVELLGANRAGPFFHLMPVFGSLLAVLFLGEAFRLFHLAGIVLIAAGLGLAARPGQLSRIGPRKD